MIGSIVNDSGITVLVAAAAVLVPLTVAVVLRTGGPLAPAPPGTPPGYAPRT